MLFSQEQHRPLLGDAQTGAVRGKGAHHEDDSHRQHKAGENRLCTVSAEVLHIHAQVQMIFVSASTVLNHPCFEKPVRVTGHYDCCA
eukprot:3799760-Amphidinium_carterae.2